MYLRVFAEVVCIHFFCCHSVFITQSITIMFQHCHNYLTEQLGVPVWGSYGIFALATLFSGLALGLVSMSCQIRQKCKAFIGTLTK